MYTQTTMKLFLDNFFSERSLSQFATNKIPDEMTLAPQKIPRLYQRDARDLAKVVPPNTVDVTITSPPYYGLKKYTKFKAKEIGRERKYEQYLENLRQVFEDCYKVTKNTGSLWIVVDSFKKNGELKLLPFDVAEEIKKIGWVLRDVIIWNKRKTLPWSKNGYFRRIFEYLLFFTKTRTPRFKYYVNRIRERPGLKNWGGWIKYPERYNPKGKVPTNIWDFPIPTQGSWSKGFIRHFCPFPPKLVRRILLLTTNKGDVVLDPFAGSGVVLAQAQYMNRKYIGLELNPKYVRKFYGQILPAMGREMEVENSRVIKAKKMRKKLEAQIRKLRLLKYPRELIKSLMKRRILDNSFNAIVVLSEAYRFSRTPMIEDIFLIFDDGMKNKKRLINEISLLLNNPPLSKFGIAPRFHLLKHAELIRNLASNKRMWLYSKITSFDRSITFSELKFLVQKEAWRKFFNHEIPPIISNIKISALSNFQCLDKGG